MTLLIRNIHTLVQMDPRDTVLHGAAVFIAGGEIRQVLSRGSRRAVSLSPVLFRHGGLAAKLVATTR